VALLLARFCAAALLSSFHHLFILYVNVVYKYYIKRFSVFACKMCKTLPKVIYVFR